MTIIEAIQNWKFSFMDLGIMIAVSIILTLGLIIGAFIYGFFEGLGRTLKNANMRERVLIGMAILRIRLEQEINRLRQK